MTAVTLCPHPVVGVGNLVVTTCSALLGAVVVLLFSYRSRGKQTGGVGLLVGNHIVDASSLVSFYHDLV